MKSKSVFIKPLVLLALGIMAPIILNFLEIRSNFIRSIFPITFVVALIWLGIGLIIKSKNTPEEPLEIDPASLRKRDMPIWWVRMGGFVVDYFLSLFISNMIIFNLYQAPDNVGFIHLLTLVLYYFVTEYLLGATLAKLIMGYKVVETNTWGPASGRQILIRTICRFIPFEGFSFIAENPYGWHDSLSRTAVIKK